MANAFSVAWVSVATYYATSETLQWRLPLALACVGPLGLLAGIYFVPGQLHPVHQVCSRGLIRIQNHLGTCVISANTMQLCKSSNVCIVIRRTPKVRQRKQSSSRSEHRSKKIKNRNQDISACSPTRVGVNAPSLCCSSCKRLTLATVQGCGSTNIC